MLRPRPAAVREPAPESRAAGAEGVVDMTGSGTDEAAGAPPPEPKRFSLRRLHGRSVVVATVLFVLVNAVAVIALAGIGAAKTRGGACGGFSGYGGSSGGSSGGGGGCETDLSITLTESPNPVHVGRRMFYLVEVTNRGPDEAYRVVVQNFLPLGVQVDWVMLPDQSYAYCEHQGRVVTCTFYYLEHHEKAGVVIVARPFVAGTANDVATVSPSFESDPDMSNNTATTKTNVKG